MSRHRIPISTWPDSLDEIQAINAIAETFLASQPELLQAINTSDAHIMFCQEAFGCSVAELLVLACAIKYVGLHGKNVIISAYRFDEEPHQDLKFPKTLSETP